MRRSGFAVAAVALLLVVGVMTYGGKLETWLLRLHGIEPPATHVELEHATPAVAGAATRATGAGTKDRDGWPDTHAGTMGRRWVSAFNTGEQAMRDTLAAIMASESLQKSAMPQRIERYRDLRERYGTLTLVLVEKSEPDRCEVTLTGSDMAEHRFVFSTQSTAPFKLVSVSMIERGHFGMGH